MPDCWSDVPRIPAQSRMGKRSYQVRAADPIRQLQTGMPIHLQEEILRNEQCPGSQESRDDAGREASRPGGFGEVQDATEENGDSASEAEKSRQQHEWSIAADQAMRSAKACGHEPAQIERPLKESR